MNRSRLIFAVLTALLLLALAAMFVVAADNPAGRAVFSVPSITCGACSQTITAGLEKLPGVSRVEVDVAKKLVSVGYDEKRLEPATLAASLETLGYPGELVATGDAAVRLKSSAAGGCGCCVNRNAE